MSLKLSLDRFEIKKVSSAKFVAVQIDDNLETTNYINAKQNIQKSCALFKAKQLLDFKSLVKVSYTFIHTCLNCAIIACTSTNKTKLKKLYNQPKHALRIIFNKDKLVYVPIRLTK